MIVKPWNKESEKIFLQTYKNKRAFTFQPTFNRALGKRYPNLIENDYIDISPRSYKKERYWINLLPHTKMKIKNTKGKFIEFEFMKKL